MSGPTDSTLAGVLRGRRRELGLTLDQLAHRVGCAKSYISAIENGHKGPPAKRLLIKLEEALALRPGELIRIAGWASTPAKVREDLAQLQHERKLASRLAELITADGIDEHGQIRGSLDEAYRSGELHRLIDRLGGGASGAAGSASSSSAVPVDLPLEVPLINNVQAGYPTEFTDLSYPARIADEYVRCPDLRDPDAFAARVVGDSMEPEYREGDIVIFSPAKSIRDGDDCFARLEPDHETTFKRVYFESGEDGDEYIRLQPTNNRYPPRTLPREGVAGLYAAVSVMRRIGG